VPEQPLIEQLYHALALMPCSCRYLWDVGPYNPSSADTMEGRRRTHQCSRCAAVERYDREHAGGSKAV
jgi:hypothetical protein